MISEILSCKNQYQIISKHSLLNRNQRCARFRGHTVQPFSSDHESSHAHRKKAKCKIT